MDGIADQMAPTFELIAETLKNVVEVDNPVLVVKYMDADGTELYSREFSSAPPPRKNCKQPSIGYDLKRNRRGGSFCSHNNTKRPFIT